MLSYLFMAGAAQNRARARHASSVGETASRTAAEIRTQSHSVRYDIEKLFMITEALWEILKFHHGYSDEQLVQMIQKIDGRDGKLDGKVTRTAARSVCAACGRTLIQRQAKCLYCGAPVSRKPFER